MKKTIDQMINDGVASIEMEGFHIDDQAKIWCKQFLLKQITKEEYIELVKKKAGVIA